MKKKSSVPPCPQEHGFSLHDKNLHEACPVCLAFVHARRALMVLEACGFWHWTCQWDFGRRHRWAAYMELVEELAEQPSVSASQPQLGSMTHSGAGGLTLVWWLLCRTRMHVNRLKGNKMWWLWTFVPWRRGTRCNTWLPPPAQLGSLKSGCRTEGWLWWCIYVQAGPHMLHHRSSAVKACIEGSSVRPPGCDIPHYMCYIHRSSPLGNRS